MNLPPEKTDNGSEVVALSPEATKLVQEIKRLDSEITTTTLMNAFFIGQKINQFYNKDYGQDKFSLLAEHTGINKNTLYKYCQVAKELTEDDIKYLCDGGHYTLALKNVKDNLTFGRKVIVQIFSESKTLKEFKEMFAKLRAERRDKESNNEKSQEGPATALPEESEDNKELNGDSHEQPTTNKDCPVGTNLASSEKGIFHDPIEQTDETPSQDEEKEGPEPGDPLDTGKGSPSESDQKPEPDENEPKEDANPEHKRIKQQVGSTVEIEPPTSESSGGTGDEILENCHVDQTGTHEETMIITRSEYDQLKEKIEEQGLENDRLREENETLRAEIDELRNENDGLKEIQSDLYREGAYRDAQKDEALA